ncbi:MAG: hypothetical protein M1827_001012 [Pycnora praestabilis]|nr:MAG: hypothetical protein M1827_001012 [Pycnora praestabilis]
MSFYYQENVYFSDTASIEQFLWDNIDSAAFSPIQWSISDQNDDQASIVYIWEDWTTSWDEPRNHLTIIVFGFDNGIRIQRNKYHVFEDGFIMEISQQGGFVDQSVTQVKDYTDDTYYQDQSTVTTDVSNTYSNYGSTTDRYSDTVTTEYDQTTDYRYNDNGGFVNDVENAAVDGYNDVSSFPRRMGNKVENDVVQDYDEVTDWPGRTETRVETDTTEEFY